eukprot:6182029-Pleurochrysis_carterae.AAC.3
MAVTVPSAQGCAASAICGAKAIRVATRMGVNWRAGAGAQVAAVDRARRDGRGSGGREGQSGEQARERASLNE